MKDFDVVEHSNELIKAWTQVQEAMNKLVRVTNKPYKGVAPGKDVRKVEVIRDRLKRLRNTGR